MMDEASTVIVLVADVVTAGAFVARGVENVLGCQSSKKKPIVLAVLGSVTGLTTTVVSPGGFKSEGSALFFPHESNKTNTIPIGAV